jgi:hypothetical protein
MSDKPDKIFARGIFFDLPSDKAPTFIKGKISMKVHEAIKFMEEYQNVGGYINLDLKVSAGGKPYVELNTFKPEPKPKEFKPAEPRTTETAQVALDKEFDAKEAKEFERPKEVDGIEYPTEEINPDEIPF